MTDLKSENARHLRKRLLIAIVPIYLSISFFHGEALYELTSAKSNVAIAQLVSVGLGPIVCLGVILYLLSNLINPIWKARMVFFRWNDPLPASRADKLIAKDARIDTANLSPVAKALLSDEMTPGERNSHWYRNIFLEIRDIPAVANTHRQYLLDRDASAGVALLSLIAALCDVIARIFFQVPVLSIYAYLALVLYTFLLASSAANSGNRMVTGAIANHSINQSEGDSR